MTLSTDVAHDTIMRLARARKQRTVQYEYEAAHIAVQTIENKLHVYINACASQLIYEPASFKIQ